MDTSSFRHHMTALQAQFDQMVESADGDTAAVRDDPLFKQASAMLFTLWETLPAEGKALLDGEARAFMAHINTPPLKPKKIEPIPELSLIHI